MTRPADYTMPPPDWVVGEEATAEKFNDLSGNTPLIYDFPTYEHKQTLVATDLLQGAFVVPADALGEFRHLHLYAEGKLFNHHGSAATAPQWSIVWDATEILNTDDGPNLADNGQDGEFKLWIDLQQRGAVDDQVWDIWGTFLDGSDTGDFSNGRGAYQGWGGGAGGFISGRKETTIDLSAGATLALKCKLPVSSANVSATLGYAKAWIL